VMWYSVKKPLEHTTIYVADMHQCILKISLEPSGWACTDDEASIVIIYGAKKRNLELVCRNRIEARIWVEAISYLIKQYNQNVQLDRLTRYFHYVDNSSGQGISPSFQARIERSPEIFAHSMSVLKRRWSDAESILNSDLLRESAFYRHLFDEMMNLQQRIFRIESSHANQTMAVFNAIQVTQIELQTLKEKFVVLENRLGGNVGSHPEGHAGAQVAQTPRMQSQNRVMQLRGATRKQRSYSEGSYGWNY